MGDHTVPNAVVDLPFKIRTVFMFVSPRIATYQCVNRSFVFLEGRGIVKRFNFLVFEHFKDLSIFYINLLVASFDYFLNVIYYVTAWHKTKRDITLSI